MAGVGTESFQAVGDQLAEASDILVFCGKNAGDISHGLIVRRAFRVPECGGRKSFSVRKLSEKLLFG